MKAFLYTHFLRISSEVLGEKKASTKKMETYLFLLLFFSSFFPDCDISVVSVPATCKRHHHAAC